MTGIVVVSHSLSLAKSAVELAKQMVADADCPAIEIAAGIEEDGFGTNAVAIQQAIEKVNDPNGVLLILDLGSAVLSAEMALEILDPEIASRVLISSAPMVEGLIAAVVSAAGGASLTEIDAEACQATVTKNEHLAKEKFGSYPNESIPAVKPSRVVSYRIASSQGIHTRPAAKIIDISRQNKVQIWLKNLTRNRGPVLGTSLTKVLSLDLRQGDQMEVSFAGEQVAKADEEFRRLADSHFGDVAESKIKENLPILSGKQIVIGSAWPIVSTVDVSNYKSGSPIEEQKRFHLAVSKVNDYLADLAAGYSSQNDIFKAQAALLADERWRKKIEKKLTRGVSATTAVHEELTNLADEFESLHNAYLKDRATDVRSIEREILIALIGEKISDKPVSSDAVWIMEELDASNASVLDPTNCAGVITTKGGATGHGVLIATARGIPCLTGREEVADLTVGTKLAFDPSSGELWINPTEELLEELRNRLAARLEIDEAAKKLASEPAITKNGMQISVGANVSSLADAKLAAQCGAEYAGLVRTEILFADFPEAPTAIQQKDVFISLASYLKGEMTIRTWDVGGDKPLPFIPIEYEDNPFLGERGIRSMRKFPEIFREQLRAVLLASQEIPVRVMFPMVTEREEMCWARNIFAEVSRELSIAPVKVGMMLEVPAALLGAKAFSGLIDFVSIGTNDLLQYICAADRNNAEVSKLVKSDSPIVLDLIGRIVRAFPGIPVGICGNMASNENLTAKFISLGIKELSVSPAIIPIIKQAIRNSI